MPAQEHLRRIILLLSLSVVIEMTLLARVIVVSDRLYHGHHMLLMIALICSQLILFRRTPAGTPARQYALWLAIGTGLTTMGDFINSAVSGIEPVSLKLTWTLLPFGAGYAIYNMSLWRYTKGALNERTARFARLRYLLALPILAINVSSWFSHVEPQVKGHQLLYYGSFVFNVTLYGMMPTLALWYFFSSDRSLGCLAVLVGALLLPYSDLILFSSWLRGADPLVPSFELYSYNWVLYFGGQTLFALFPALAIIAAPGSNPPPGSRTGRPRQR